jgi:hypothetical protein
MGLYQAVVPVVGVHAADVIADLADSYADLADKARPDRTTCTITFVPAA